MNHITSYNILSESSEKSFACVAGGISRASAFVLVAKDWSRVELRRSPTQAKKLSGLILYGICVWTEAVSRYVLIRLFRNFIYLILLC